MQQENPGVNIVMFLGRNTGNILSDYLRLSKAKVDSVTIIARDDDPLLNPELGKLSENVVIKTVDQFLGRVISDGSIQEPGYVVICNGGTTAQQVPIVKWLARYSFTNIPGAVGDASNTTFIEVTKDEINVL